MLQANKILRVSLLLFLASLTAATDSLCENGEPGDCSDTVALPQLEDEDARGVYHQGPLGYSTLLSYFTTMVPASQGTGRTKPLKFRFRFPYVQEPNTRPAYVHPTWEIKDRLGYAEPPIWGPREPTNKRGNKNEPNRGRQEPLRRGPPILEMRSDDEIEDFNERKYQAYAEYYGLPYKGNRDGTKSNRRRNGNNKNKKKKGTSSYSVQKKTVTCEDDQNPRGCVKYYDSHGYAHLYENHPFAEEVAETTTTAPVQKKTKSSLKSRPKSSASKPKRSAQKKRPQVEAPSIIIRNPVPVSSYSLKRKNKGNNRNPNSNKKKKNNKRKGQKNASQVVGTPENHDDSLEGVDRETLQYLYNRNHQPPRRYTYKLQVQGQGQSNGNRRNPNYSEAPADY